MLQIIKNINVLSVGPKPIINLSQYDSDFQLVFNLYTSEGTLSIGSGATAMIQETKTDGNGYSADCEIAGNSVTVDGHIQMTACAGPNVCEIVIFENDRRIGTINFVLMIERAALDLDTPTSESVIRDLENIPRALEDAEQAKEDAEAAADRAEEAAQTLVIDPTLTQPNQAAGAKATGDALNLKADQTDVDDLKADLNKQNSILETVSEKVFVITEHYELGSIAMSNSGWTYNETSTSIRTRQGYTIHLRPGDSFGSDGTQLNFRMLVGWQKTSDQSYSSYSSFIYDRYTATEEGDFVFSIQFTNGSIYTAEELMSHFYIKRIDNKEIDVDENKSRISTIAEDGKDKIPAHFFRGAFTSATNFTTTSTTARQRIMSLDYIKYDRTVTIKAKTGYQFSLYLYSSPGTSTGAVSFTDETTIPAGQMFRISITKTTPETINVFDISEYVNSVSVTTFVSDNVEFLKKSIGTSNRLAIQIGLVRYGSSNPDLDGLWTAGQGKTIATPAIYKFPYPVLVSMDWQKYPAYIYFYSTDNEHDFSNRTSVLTADYEIPENSYFRIMVTKADSSAFSAFDVIDASDSLTVYGLTGSYTRETAHDLQNKIANISRYDPIAILPHVAAEIDRVDKEIKSKYGLGNLGMFGFNTDQHLRDNAIDQTKNSRVYCIRGLRAMSILTQRNPFDFVCLGGDAVGYYTTTIPGILNDVVEVNAALHDAGCPVLSISGNHDAYENNHSMTNGDIYFANVKKAEKIANITMDEEHTNYVLDSKGNKIRYIFLDDTPRDGYTLSDCADYLDASLQGTPEGYSIVIISHHAISSALDPTIFPNPLGLQSHLVNYKDDIICCVNGHAHRDGSETSADILYIETTSAGLDGLSDGYERVLDSATETAQDIYIIDKNAKKIYTVRYGAGSNREFDYDSTSETFGEIVT